MKINRSLVPIVVICLLLPGIGQATSYTVPATANIFSAGLASPVAPGGGGAGTLPVSISFSPDSSPLAFADNSGIVSPFNNFYSLGAEGIGGTPSSLNSVGSISGYLGDNTFPLVGVFLAATAPSGPAPATLDFTSSGLGRNFLTLSPQIGQVFFIGDGRTDSNAIQTFIPPAGATRLFIGFPDGVNFMGDPGAYADNTGSLNIEVTPVPEPASGLLILAGAALMWKIRKKTTALPQ